MEGCGNGTQGVSTPMQGVWSLAAAYGVRLCDTLRHASFVPPSLSPASRPRTSPSLSYQVGDVIYIEANSGAVKRVGRCDAYATEFDLEAEEYVPLAKVWMVWIYSRNLRPPLLPSRPLMSSCPLPPPQGDVHKKKEVVQDVTLHDLDSANARPQV